MPENKRPMMEYALEYAEKYGWYVLPCSRSKSPYTEHGLNDATRDPEQIRQWWQKWPYANIGVNCERSGLLVIDLDNKDGVSGFHELEKWKKENDLIWPETATVITGSGGTHLYYTYPYSEENPRPVGTVGILEGVDIRSKNYVLVPPSVNKKGSYVWEDPPEDGIAAADDAVLSLCKFEGNRDVIGNNKKLKVPKKINSGTRNDMIYKIGCSMQSQGFPDSAILAAMKETNESLCDPPLDDAEIERTFGSVLSKEKGKIHAGGGGRKQKEPLSISVLEESLSEQGVSLQLNLITHEVEFKGLSEEYNPESNLADLGVILLDRLKKDYGCSKELIIDYLRIIAGKQRYNPVLDYLNSIKWDGKNYLEEFYEILDISQKDPLSRTLVRKWLCQCVAMARNNSKDPYGADGVLVLTGPQGIGKTSVGAKLGTDQKFFSEGQYIDTSDKDTTRRCTTNWIIELGELETTFRSDLERIKAFITSKIDVYRLPYGRGDEKHVRRASIMATCNSSEFLKDPTGSRRFWTVPVEAIDLDHLNKFDVDGLWSQIVQIVNEEGPQCFRLSAMERGGLEHRNREHEVPLKAETEIQDIFTDYISNTWRYELKDCTVSEWIEHYGSLSRYSAAEVGRVLKKKGLKQSKGHSKGRTYRLPVRNWYATRAESQ